MIPVKEFDAESILDDSVFIELFEMEDLIERSKRIIQLTQRAKALGVKGYFEEQLRAYKQVDREMKRQAKEKYPVSTLDNYTNFTGGGYDRMYCGMWIANDSGIYSQKSGGIEEVVCYHPILPIERLKNLETGEEQIKLAYKRNGRWQEIIVPKTMITSANKIVALSGRGIAVTSENAKLLVKYLADVENGNDDYINVQYSTSKLGWINNEFIPFDTSIIFDGDMRFKTVFDSISERGSYDDWLDHVKELRASGRIELKFLLAASFASVLVQILGGLPFFVDLWGETEGGKTVSLMVAASVWANPDESKYIGDFKTTDVALEAKADMLNHLPMFLDDTSKVSARIRDNFEGIVYDLCSGKGKSRSNKELGVNRENRWRNVMICNGERPLSGYVNQGGAINRILEIECGEKVYEDPQTTANTVKMNYGHAGKHFVEIIKQLGVDKIRKIQQEFQTVLFDTDKMQKQSLSLSIVLTADKIATDYIFNDKKYIVIHETDNFKKGADALRHAKAQCAGNLSTSVHFYCGSDGVYQAASLDRCVWAVGKKYKTMPIKDASNYNTINIEICVNEDGDYNVARQNAIELVKYLMAELNIPADRVIRHYDAKGKYCPRKMMDNPALWDDFKNSIQGKVETNTQNTAQNSSAETPFLIKIDKVNKNDVLNIRKEPNANAIKTGALAYNDPNTYTIVEVKNGWGKLKSKIGWINLNYTKKVSGEANTTQTLVTAPKVSYYPAFSGSSIVDGLKSIGVDSSKANRTKIAKANGISNYIGTASQNTKLLSLAKQGKLKKA